jgi:hypothetical protein
LCVVEIESRRGGNGQKEEHYLVRHLERLPVGTSYPKMAERCGEVAKAVKDRTRSRPEAYVDATGFGGELVDLVKKHGDYSRVRPVYFNHGDRRTQEKGEVKLGKGWSVCRMQTLLQTGKLHLPRSTEAETLAEELMDFEVKPQPDNDLYGAYKVGTQDELVTALGLAVQKPPSGRIEHGWVRL